MATGPVGECANTLREPGSKLTVAPARGELPVPVKLEAMLTEPVKFLADAGLSCFPGRTTISRSVHVVSLALVPVPGAVAATAAAIAARGMPTCRPPALFTSNCS